MKLLSKAAKGSSARSDRSAGKPGASFADRIVPDATTTKAVSGRGGHLLAWALLVSGPVLSVMLSQHPQVQQASSSTPVAPPEDVGAQGWAQLYVRAWLSASSTNAADLKRYNPAADAPERGANTQIPVATNAVKVERQGPGLVNVTVAAEVSRQTKSGRTRETLCTRVPVIEQRTNASVTPTAYVAAAMPAVVGCPASLSAPALDYPNTVSADSALGRSATGFLAAYLTGQGQMDRFTSPAVNITAAGKVFDGLQVQTIAVQQQLQPGQDGRPLDGDRVKVLVTCDGMDSLSQPTPVQYALTLTARSSRWEVSGFDGMPAIQPTAQTGTVPGR